MTGVLNRSFLLAFCLLFASCKNFDAENGRYTVIERKMLSKPAPELRHLDLPKYYYSYYLLDTKTGKIKEINFSKLPTDTKH